MTIEQDIKTHDKKKCAVYIVVSANRKMSCLMKWADLFEKGKELGMPEQYTLSYNDDVDLTLEHASKSIEHLRDAITQAGNIVTLVHLLVVKNDTTYIENRSILPYINKEVRCISSGSKWGMVDDYLEWLGFKVTTNEHKFITDIAFK